jgi:hypothetical protein
MSTPDSHWGDLDEDRIARIKSDMRDIVEEAVEAAMRKSLEAQRNTIADGVAQGIGAVAADDELFSKIGDRIVSTFRTAARNSAGEFILSGGLRLLKAAGWLALALFAVWSVFGWSGVAFAWKYVTTQAHVTT